MREIAPEPEDLYRKLKRVRVADLKTVDDAGLAERLRGHERALCVVDARAHARELYETVGPGEGVFHLSALMCPKHRSARLKEIRRRLAGGARCVVVSTSLVEAGVDVDFPVVYRALAGIDSLAQAAGRCNREGRLTEGEMFVFRPAGRTLVAERQRRAGAAEAVMRRHEDPLSLEAVRAFFAELYWAEGDGLDRKELMKLHEGSGDPLLPFERIAREFRMIEEGMMPVIVPWDAEAEGLVGELHRAPKVGAIARKLQRYVVQIPPKALAALLAAGSAAEIAPPGSEQRFHVLVNKDLYRDDVGLTWDDPTWREVGAMIV